MNLALIIGALALAGIVVLASWLTAPQRDAQGEARPVVLAPVVTFELVSCALRPTCPLCGSDLEPWGTCPNVAPEIAATISTSRRPRYCDMNETAAQA